MLPPINRATDPVSRAQMRLEYRLVNLLGQSRFAEVQPLLQALLAAKEAKPAAVSRSKARDPWGHVEVHHHHYHLPKVNAN